MKKAGEIMDKWEMLEVPYTCADCGAPGMYRTMAGLTGRTMHCPGCAEKRCLSNPLGDLVMLMDRAKIPVEYRDWDPALGNPALHDWIRWNRSEFMWIAAPHGFGKTRATARVAIECAKKGNFLLWCFMPDWCLQLSAALGKDADRALSMVYHAKRVQVLIWDDFGKEKPTERIAEQLFSIVDDRTRRRAPIWITTNFNSSEISARIETDHGPAIMSRLREVCKAYDPI